MQTTGLVAQPASEHYTKPPVERYCYVCAVQGHYGHDCPLRYNNVAYSQVPQSVVSYSCPVTSVNGSFVVNIEGAQAPVEVSVVCFLTSVRKYFVGSLQCPLMFYVIGF